MKPSQSLIAATLLALAAPQMSAQTEVVTSGPVTTGSVVSIDQPKGLMTVQSAQLQAPITFYGMEKAKVESSGGQLLTLAQIRPQMPVTVHYTPIEGRWYVGKVVIPDPQAVPVAVVPSEPLTAAEQKALNTKAATDGDITTKPGVKARIDSDITTKPGKKDPADPDITKKAGD
jgi:hypothetical protein